MKFYHEASKIVKPKLEALAVAEGQMDAANKVQPCKKSVTVFIISVCMHERKAYFLMYSTSRHVCVRKRGANYTSFFWEKSDAHFAVLPVGDIFDGTN